jgi:hypothetical protein
MKIMLSSSSLQGNLMLKEERDREVVAEEHRWIGGWNPFITRNTKDQRERCMEAASLEKNGPKFGSLCRDINQNRICLLNEREMRVK